MPETPKVQCSALYSPIQRCVRTDVNDAGLCSVHQASKSTEQQYVYIVHVVEHLNPGDPPPVIVFGWAYPTLELAIEAALTTWEPDEDEQDLEWVKVWRETIQVTTANYINGSGYVWSATDDEGYYTANIQQMPVGAPASTLRDKQNTDV
jgi:hypothetical protein